MVWFWKGCVTENEKGSKKLWIIESAYVIGCLLLFSIQTNRGTNEWANMSVSLLNDAKMQVLLTIKNTNGVKN